MGRLKKENKNQIVSVSIKQHQKDFLDMNKDFDFSKFVQIHLEEYINLNDELEDVEKCLIKEN